MLPGIPWLEGSLLSCQCLACTAVMALGRLCFGSLGLCPWLTHLHPNPQRYSANTYRAPVLCQGLCGAPEPNGGKTHVFPRRHWVSG